MSSIRTRLTYANVMATIAVFGVLGGGAYAASKIGPEDIKKNAVRAEHIKDRSLLAKEFKAGELPAGPTSSSASVNPNPNIAPAPCCPSPPQYVQMISTDVRMKFAGRLIANASLKFAGGAGGFVGCRLQVASGPAFTSWSDMSQDSAHSVNSVQMSLVAGIARPAGTYRVRVGCYDNSDWAFDRGDITVVATAR